MVGLRPCTPLGVMRLLQEAGTDLDGAESVILGRSNLFGKPMGRLLVEADATMTICHSHTRDLAAACRRADVLVAAVGRPKLVQGDWIKPGATVIDVGITRTDDGLVGDVDFDAAMEVASADHPGAGRRRADDDRVPAAEHAPGGALDGVGCAIASAWTGGPRRVPATRSAR